MHDAFLFDLFQRLGMALAIGFLVGVERGWTHRAAPEGSRAAGLRTHAIIGLLGGVCGIIALRLGPIPLAALTLAFAACFLAFKWREADRDNDVSVTGTMGGLLVFALGVYCTFGDLRIAAAVGVALTILLAFKHALHGWLASIKAAELDSALLILAATAIALPLLPDRPVDPWGAINPRELWVLTILVASASFAGYVAIRWLGEGVGLVLGAAIGAIVSSTVTTADLARRYKRGEAPLLAAASAANLASVIMAARVAVLVAAFAPTALAKVGPAIAAAGAVALAAAGLLHALDGRLSQKSALPNLSSPLDLLSVTRFALLLGFLLVIGRLLAAHYGPSSLLPFAATAGLADVDAVTLAVAGMVRTGLSADLGAAAILLAAFVDTASKSGIVFFVGGPRFGGLFALCSIAALAAGAGVWFLL
ncbi:MAG TPA: DUF4010 domain-containing protein [Caulobacterales bacterium]|nr:DUF4010 domain-containing protein [Caulobacterales bacterium]